ncbi:MAG: Cys-tRNA(Pro) deacylase [Clostridia bacterium]|nr:Cys-tRNA(Pro) deacylase [Clostridia bacterium]
MKPDKKPKEEKTNVLRLAEQKKIPHTAHTYPHAEGEAVDARTAAELMGLPARSVFKTLVTLGAKDRVYVFVIPADSTLDLKKAAKACGEKSIQMLPQNRLLPLTGYVHGGCSPVGMKKLFPTYLDASCLSLPSMTVSAGKIGFQIELAPKDLISLCRGKTADLAAPSAEEDDETNP